MIGSVVAALIVRASELPVQIPTIPDAWSPVGLAVAFSILIGALIKFRGRKVADLGEVIKQLEGTVTRLERKVDQLEKDVVAHYEAMERERKKGDRQYDRAELFRRFIVRYQDAMPGAAEVLKEGERYDD